MRVCWHIKQHGFFTIRQNRQSQICTDTGTSGQSGEAYSGGRERGKELYHSGMGRGNGAVSKRPV